MTTQGWVHVEDAYERDKRNKLTLEKRYTVWGYAAAAVIADPSSIINESGESLPGFGSSAGGFELDRYDVTQSQDGTISATAVFSTDDIGVLPVRPSQERVGFQAFSLNTWEGVLEIPVAFRQDYTAPGGELTEPAVFKTWVISTEKLRIGTSRRQFRTTRASMSPSDFEAVERQTGKLHLLSFGGTPRYFLFEGAQASQQDRGMWSISYSWVREDGVEFFEISVDGAFDETGSSIATPPGITSGTIQTRIPEWGEEGAWIVPPYHKISLSLDTKAPLGLQPVYSAILTHDIDNLGWQTLPGLT